MYIVHLRGHLNAHQYAPALTHCMNPWNACHQSVLLKALQRRSQQKDANTWAFDTCCLCCIVHWCSETALIMSDSCMACGVSVASFKWYSLGEARHCIFSLFGLCGRGVRHLNAHKIIPDTDRRSGIFFPWHLKSPRMSQEWCYSEPWHAVPHFIFLQE